MADQEQVDLLKQGAEAWNQWREKNTGEFIDLSDADLNDADLNDADLNDADLSGATLLGATLMNTKISAETKIDAKWKLVHELVNKGGEGKDLSGANLSGANLWHADLRRANLSDADLSDADLRRANLSDADLSGADLSVVALSGANLSGADLRRANLSGANLRRANLSDADLSDANLSVVALSDANLSDADLRRANLRRANLSDADLSDADLSGANLNGADLRRADLSGANLNGADLRRADLSVVALSGADLSGADLSGADLRRADLNGADLRRANLNGADLNDADLNDADLNDADLSGATLLGATLMNTKISAETKIDAKWKLVHELVNKGGEGKDLSGANLSGANLRRANLRRADLRRADLRRADLSDADLSGTDLSGTDLSGTDLTDANLLGAALMNTKISAETEIDAKWKLVHELVNKGGEGKDLSGTDLNDANLSGANLRNSNLYRANFLGSKLQNAILTGACIQDWSINSKTGFEGVVCDYIYLKVNQEERRPFQGNFCPGEFVALVQKSLETVDLIFVDGIDWQAFFQSFQLLRSKFNEHEVGIQAIEKKGAAFVVRLEAPPEADKSTIETKAKELYGKQLKVLEEQFIEKMKLQGATLDLAKESLTVERQKNAQLLSMVETMANKDKVTQNFNAQVGNVAGVNEGIQQTTQHNYAPEIKQTPAESAKEIQDLLSQLQKTNPTDIQTVVEQRIKTDPTFRQRLQNALKEGGVETLKVLFAPIGIPIEIVKGWINAEGS